MRRPKLAIALALVATMAFTGVASATHWIAPDSDATNAVNAETHYQVAGNPRCDGSPFYQLKIEDWQLTGPFPQTFDRIIITAYDGKHVSWMINPAYLGGGNPLAVDASVVIVKGGPTAMIYEYNDVTDDSDTGLTAPRNPNGAGPKYYGISHVQFCFDPKYAPA